MRQQAAFEITGYLSRDGELRQTRDGRPVLGLSVPFTRRRLNKQTNEWEDAAPTLWAQCALWDDAATQFADQMRKGTPVHVRGVPELRPWEKDGRSGVNLEIQFAEVSIVAEAPRRQHAEQPPAEDAWATPGAWGDDTPF